LVETKPYVDLEDGLRIFKSYVNDDELVWHRDRENREVAVFEILTQFGLPVAAAATMGVFIYIILKYILSGIVDQVSTLTMIISQLDNRVKTMNHDMIKLDLLISHALNLKPDLDRMSRADGKEDARKD
jgi:hypothetical protein